MVNLAALVAGNPVNYITMEAPEIVTSDHILGGVTWLTDTEIAMHWLNRRQNYTVLQICDVETLKCEVSLHRYSTLLFSCFINFNCKWRILKSTLELNRCRVITAADLKTRKVNSYELRIINRLYICALI